MENLKIEYNKNIINKFKEYDILADHIGSIMFILFALDEEKYELLNEYDDSNKQRRVIILYRQMERRNLLQANHGKYLYQLTKEGKELVDYARSEFENNHIEVKAKDFATLVKEIDEKSNKVQQTIGVWIKDYIDNFPKERRDNSKVVSMRMEEFINVFGFSPEVIIGASKMYNDYHRKENTALQYIRKSQYFIYEGRGKSRVWDLATWCERFISEKQDKKTGEDIDTSIFDRV